MERMGQTKKSKPHEGNEESRKGGRSGSDAVEILKKNAKTNGTPQEGNQDEEERTAG